MANRLETYRFIAQILNPEIKKTALESILQHPKFDWDTIVVEGSRHLVLPALYCNLKNKGLLHCMPEELNVYLEELTSINRNRNLAITTQINKISDIFREQGIDHVMLKGAALLMAKAYEDIGERMVGDIDILVAEDQLEQAYSLLKNGGYFHDKATFGHTYIEHKHLPRLQTNEFISAVELHRKLFINYNEEVLSNSALLRNKNTVNGVKIPRYDQLLLHSILNFQINDKGKTFKMVSFRTSYDILRLQKLSGAYSTTNPIVKSYLKYHNIFFNDNTKTLKLGAFSRQHYYFRLKNKTYDSFWYRLRYTGDYLIEVLKRTQFLLTSKHYRRSLVKDRKRILYTLKRQLIDNKKPS